MRYFRYVLEGFAKAIIFFVVSSLILALTAIGINYLIESLGLGLMLFCILSFIIIGGLTYYFFKNSMLEYEIAIKEVSEIRENIKGYEAEIQRHRENMSMFKPGSNDYEHAKNCIEYFEEEKVMSMRRVEDLCCKWKIK